MEKKNQGYPGSEDKKCAMWGGAAFMNINLFQIIFLFHNCFE